MGTRGRRRRREARSSNYGRRFQQTLRLVAAKKHRGHHGPRGRRRRRESLQQFWTPVPAIVAAGCSKSTHPQSGSSKCGCRFQQILMPFLALSRHTRRSLCGASRGFFARSATWGRVRVHEGARQSWPPKSPRTIPSPDPSGGRSQPQQVPIGNRIFLE